MKPIQLERPTFTNKEEYSFPYWTLKDRVKGQPTNHLNTKYDATYKRVAEMMIKMGPHHFADLNLLGLFATNHRTIGDYLQFQFQKHSSIIPNIKTVGVVEKNLHVVTKIKKIEESFRNDSTQVFVIPTLMKHLTWEPSIKGQIPAGIDQIIQFQNHFTNQINFIDADFMVNWTNHRLDLKNLIKLIETYSKNISVIHINAISDYSRTRHWSSTEEEIQEILEEELVTKIDGQIIDLSLQSYNTYSEYNNVKTQMTSAVFGFKR